MIYWMSSAPDLMKNKFRNFAPVICGIAMLLPVGGFAQGKDVSQNDPVSEPKISQDEINARIKDSTVTTDGQVESADKKTRPKLDLAYGAFQRGHYLTAFEHALPRAKLGDPAAQTLIAEIYDKGLGIKLDKSTATQWYKFAAEGGSREAQFSYALKLLEGKYVEKNKIKARALLEQAANAGHSVAQFNFAQIIVDERPTSRGYEIALGYYAKSASSGVANAYYAMAKIYARGYGIHAPDETKARALLIKAARNGIDNAQIELAIWLANGRGGNKDTLKALSWFKIAANGGNVVAQNRLARMLALGLGGEVEPKEAAKWYVLARRRGHKDSMLDDFFSSLSPQIRKQALEAANRWPSS